MALKGKGSGKGDDDEDGDLFMPIKDVVAKLKQGPLNFGLYQTTDKDKPVLLAAHKRKASEMLGKQAKKAAGTPKGSFGVLTLDGGVLNFECAGEDVPRSLAKRIRLMLKSEGFGKFKARLLLPGGVELGEDDEEEGEEGDEGPLVADAGDAGEAGPEDPMEELRRQLTAEFEELSGTIAAALALSPSPAVRKIEGLQAMFQAEIGRDPRKCMGIMTVLHKTVESAGLLAAAGGDAEAEAERRAAAIAARSGALADLEQGIDALIAEFA